MPRPSGRPIALAMVVVVAVLAVATAPGSVPSAAQPSPGSTGRLAATAGWEGRFRPGRPMPVAVTVPRGGGTITATVEAGGTSTSTSAPAPSRGPRSLVVDTPWDATRLEVTVALSREGRSVATGRAVARASAEDEVVGVFGALAATRPSGTFPLAVDVGTATAVRLIAADLVHPGSLGPLGTLATAGADLSGLDRSARRGLMAWLAGGGHLLVDDDAAPEWLPSAWRPGDGSQRAAAGMGEVRLTGGRLAAGAWANVVEPTPTVTPGDPALVAPAFAAAGPVGPSLAADTALRIPPLALLLAFLVGWAALAGPVCVSLLRRRGQIRLVWLVVPAAAVVVTALVVAVGPRLRDPDRAAFGAFVLTTPGADLAGTSVGVLSRDGGQRSVDLPSGWTASAVTGERFGEAGVPVTWSTPTNGPPSATIDLVGGQFGVLEGHGSLDPARQLQVEAVTGRDAVTGTVTNDSGGPLAEVVVFVGDRAVPVGTVAAGGSTEWRIDLSAARPPGDRFTPVESLVWPEAFAASTVADGFPAGDAAGQLDGGGADPADPVDLSVWTEVLDTFGPNLRAPGAAVAVGWTAALAAPVDIGPRSSGHTAVMARAPVRSSGPLTGWDVRRELLRGPAAATVDGPPGTPPVQGAVVRFVVPGGDGAAGPAADGGLELVVPAAVATAEVWTRDGWTVLDVGSSSPDLASPAGAVALPDRAVTDGAVHVRIGVRTDAPPAGAAELLVRSAR